MICQLDLTNEIDIERLRVFSKKDLPSQFRYFKNRNFEEAIKTHKLTILYESEPGGDVGYAHVDVDTKTNKAFFGICILPGYQSKGIGQLLLSYILEHFSDDLYLTVDIDNIKARRLYEKNNFTVCETYTNSELRVRYSS
jgi:ribosomal protein S18 acetylase RimI-like enzyme